MKRLILSIMTYYLLSGVGVLEARYLNNGDGTVSDTQTGLMWQQATSPNSMKLNDAMAYCNNLVLAGYSDWRLPDFDELNSLVDDNYNPRIDPTYFPETIGSWYWSSTLNDLLLAAP